MDIVDGAHLTPDIDAAQAYLDNPGFGGQDLYAYDIDDPQAHLELHRLKDSAALDRLAEELEYEDPEEVAQKWRDAGHDRVNSVLENITDVDRRIHELYDWVSFKDDYPPDAETWKYLGAKRITGGRIIRSVR